MTWVWTDVGKLNLDNAQPKGGKYDNQRYKYKIVISFL